MKIISFLLGGIISLIIILSFNSKRQDKSLLYKILSLKEYQELTGYRQDYHESENAIYGREKIYSKDVASAEKTAIFVANVLYKHTGKENSDIKILHNFYRQKGLENQCCRARFIGSLYSKT